MSRLATCSMLLLIVLAAGLRAERSASTTEPSPHPDLAEIHPTTQELHSPTWWVERAMEQAADVTQGRDRARAFWMCGVTAFDCGRFDLVQRIIAMNQLDGPDKGTLASRLAFAFEQTGDVERLRQTTQLFKPGSFERDQIFDAIVKILIARHDLDAAERVADEQISPGNRSQAYFQIVDAAASESNLQRTWRLATKAAADEVSSGATYGLRVYLKQAIRLRRPDAEDAAINAILARSLQWPNEMRAEDFRELANTLSDEGELGLARKYRTEAAKLAPQVVQPKASWARINDLALDGKFDDAFSAAESDTNLWDRAYGYACIATKLAEGSPHGKKTALALNKAAAALAEIRAQGRTDAPDMIDLNTIARQLACAQAEAQDAAGALRTLGDLPASQAMQALVSLAAQRAQANDMNFIQMARESDLCRDATKQEKDQMDLIWVGLQADTHPAAAESVAAKIQDKYFQSPAYLALLRAAAGRNDAAAFDRLIEIAIRTILQTPDPREGLEEVARLRARMLRLQAIWDSAVAERAPMTRVHVMLGGAEGLLWRLGASPGPN